MYILITYMQILYTLDIILSVEPKFYLNEGTEYLLYGMNT